MKFAIELKIEENSGQEKSQIAESILRSLPQWFGIEESILKYIKEVEKLPTIIARSGERGVGFLSFKQHNESAAELLVMGIYPDRHRLGIGKLLIQETESILRQRNIEYWQVKTVAPSRVDRFYDGTRAFYLKMGFRPLEEFTQIWGKDNPCLIMVKAL